MQRVQTIAMPEKANPRAPQSWDLDATVDELLAIYSQTMFNQRKATPTKLPSASAVRRIIDSLSTAMFPRRYACNVNGEAGLAYFIGDTLETTFHELVEQIERELVYFGDSDSDTIASEALKDSIEPPIAQARRIVAEFCSTLPAIRRVLESDVTAAFKGDPAAKNPDEVLLCYPGITAMIHHRVAHQLCVLGAPVIARMIAERAHSITGIDIHPGAQIGHSFFIDHGTGVVIGGTSIIGNRVRIYQGVTLGAVRFPSDEQGTLLKGHPRHPIIEDDVVIYAGATILGRITIGSGSIIGGNVWLTRGVPPGSQISQARVRTEHFDDGGGI